MSINMFNGFLTNMLMNVKIVIIQIIILLHVFFMSGYALD